MLKQFIWIPIYMSASLAWGEPQYFVVFEHLNAKSQPPLVLVSGGSRENLDEGMTFRTLRIRPGYAPRGIKDSMIETGTLKLIKVMETQSIAAVIQDGSELSKAVVPKFAGVMAGDLVQIVRPLIAKNQFHSPHLEYTYKSLFEDPNGVPLTYDLSENGKQRLRETLAVFQAAKVGKIVVEGYTDEQGSSNGNYLESLQRAQIVRQHIIADLQFDPERVLAMGLGESEQVDRVKPGPESHEKNRRIVIKSYQQP